MPKRQNLQPGEGGFFVHLQVTMQMEEALEIREAAKAMGVTVPVFVKLAALKEARGGKS